jgi:16S rRNA processing protein RimM
LGDLTDILVTGANDVYVVTNADGRELLLPAIPAVILDVDLDANQMHVHLLPGLIDEG